MQRLIAVVLIALSCIQCKKDVVYTFDSITFIEKSGQLGPAFPATIRLYCITPGCIVDTTFNTNPEGRATVTFSNPVNVQCRVEQTFVDSTNVGTTGQPRYEYFDNTACIEQAVRIDMEGTNLYVFRLEPCN